MQTTKAQRLAALRKRRDALNAELARLEAKERGEKRKDDTRRKILLGAVVMQEMENKPDKVGAWARKLLEDRLTKDRDRDLFDLPPLQTEKLNSPTRPSAPTTKSKEDAPTVGP
jgi:large subunit ribosomal protein L7/L12